MQLDATQLLVGPEFTWRSPKFNLFTHILFGLTRMSLSELNGYSYISTGLVAVQTPDFANVAHRTNLALGAGGGLERNWKKHFALRLFQADYIPTRLDGKWESHFRVGIGILVKF